MNQSGPIPEYPGIHTETAPASNTELILPLKCLDMNIFPSCHSSRSLHAFRHSENQTHFLVSTIVSLSSPLCGQHVSVWDASKLSSTFPPPLVCALHSILQFLINSLATRMPITSTHHKISSSGRNSWLCSRISMLQNGPSTEACEKGW